MADPFTGEIRAFCFTYAPLNWAFCNGAQMNITQNNVLYSVIGATYGQANNQTFNLPNLQGQAPMHSGSPAGGPGGPAAIVEGQQYGETQVTLSMDEIPNHTHVVTGASGSASLMTAAPASNSLLSHPVLQATQILYLAESNQNSPDVRMSPAMIQPAGQGLPHNNMQPYLALNFCICLAGEYPVPPE